MKLFRNIWFHRLIFYVFLPLFIVVEIITAPENDIVTTRLIDISIGFLIAIDIMGILSVNLKRCVEVRPNYGITCCSSKCED